MTSTTIIAQGLLGPLLLTGGYEFGVAPPVNAVVGPGPVETGDVIASIQTWWGQTGAAACGVPRLWHMVAPEGQALPYLTVFLASESVETWTTDYPFQRSEVQFNAHAATSAAARSLAITLRKTFRGAPLFIDGSRVAHVLPDQHGIHVGEGLAPNGQDCWIATETFDIAWSPR